MRLVDSPNERSIECAPSLTGCVGSGGRSSLLPALRNEIVQTDRWSASESSRFSYLVLPNIFNRC